MDINVNYIHQVGKEQMFLEKPAISSEIKNSLQRIIRSDRITTKDLRRHLLPLLAKGKLPERTVMVGEVERFLKPYVMLTDLESKAIEAFYAGGALATEVLFPDSEIQSKVRIAPSLLWKVQHLVPSRR